MRASTIASWTLCVTVCLIAWAPLAHAQDDEDDDVARFTLALDLDSVQLVDLDALEGGGGAALRFGTEVDLILLTLIPEGYLGYHAFGDGDTAMTSARIGGRLRIGKIIEPGIFGHVGFARVSGGPSYWTGAIDLGLSLDFTLLPLVDIGAHVAYDTVLDTTHDPDLSHANVGLHAAVVL